MKIDWRRGAGVAGAVILGVAMVGCAASGGEEIVIASEDEGGELSAAEMDGARRVAMSTEPVTGDSASLWVHGLSCPLCATNVDTVLKRVEGVRDVAVDLDRGVVQVGFEGATRPSPRDLWRAIDRSGFTLVKVEVP